MHGEADGCMCAAGCHVGPVDCMMQLSLTCASAVTSFLTTSWYVAEFLGGAKCLLRMYSCSRQAWRAWVSGACWLSDGLQHSDGKCCGPAHELEFVVVVLLRGVETLVSCTAAAGKPLPCGNAMPHARRPGLGQQHWQGHLL
jgi:hypothetical protein